MRIIMTYVGGCLDKKTMTGDSEKPYDEATKSVNVTVERYLFTNHGTVGKQFEVRNRGLHFDTYEIIECDTVAYEIHLTVKCVASD
jgi:hypothetical protein